MGNFEKNEQNPHDNLKPKFRQKLLKMNKTHKKSMSSRRIHTLFFCLQQDMSFTHSQTAAVCAGSHSTNVFLYPHVDAD